MVEDGLDRFDDKIKCVFLVFEAGWGWLGMVGG